MSFSCNGKATIGSETTTTGVDSVFVSMDDNRILVIVVYSTRGIGNLKAALSGPLFAETVQFRFYYAEGRPYASCENLQAIIQGLEPEEQVQLQSGSYSFVNGTIGVSAGIEVEAIDVSWIDFYRD